MKLFRLFVVPLAALAVMVPCAFAQGGSTYGTTFVSGTPTGNCNEGLLAVDTTNDRLWACHPGGTWIQINAPAALPSGGELLIFTGACPSGTTEDDTLNGQMVEFTTAANSNVGTTGGSNSITPEGTNSAPLLTMNPFTPAGTNSAPALTMNPFTPAGSNSAPSLTMNPFTPAGTNSAPTFTGTLDTTSAVSAGTPAGTNSTASFSATGVDIGTTTTSHTISVFNGTTIASGTNTLSVPAETFTGTALATHTHTVTPTGSVSAPTFTGTQVTPTGSVAAPAFTGTQVTPTGSIAAPAFTGTQATLTGSVAAPAFSGVAFDPHPAFTRVIACKIN